MSASFAAASQPSPRAHTMSTANHGAPAQAHGAMAGVAGLDSAALLNGQKAVTIVHNGTPYRLQATKLGKLILTK